MWLILWKCVERYGTFSCWQYFFSLQRGGNNGTRTSEFFLSGLLWGTTQDFEVQFWSRCWIMTCVVELGILLAGNICSLFNIFSTTLKRDNSLLLMDWLRWSHCRSFPQDWQCDLTPFPDTCTILLMLKWQGSCHRIVWSSCKGFFWEHIWKILKDCSYQD
jgi:hypothetical protein